ncbi:MAG: type II toxin-antitoxin system HipA family toxin [Actinomycetales bacterium]
MPTRELALLMAGTPMGVLRQNSNGPLTFRYDRDYAANPRATPLSLSMPVSDEDFRGRALTAFLWGLLPDNNEVLQRWGARYGVSANNPFALLANVGEDCAGAVQFVAPERIASLSPGGVSWLEESDLGDWVRQLREDPAAWLQSVEQGQFSLAGAQAKFAVAFHRGRWGRPYGAVPTTHIVKPASGRFADQELTEHLSLRLADALGMVTAESSIHEFDGERVVVVKRYDRRFDGGQVRRIHQEDLCQALKVQPSGKYQSDGGPSPRDVVRLLRGAIAPSRADQDVWRFVSALALNWVIAGADAHAKNYSLLLDGSQVRLAPLYDVVSGLPYFGAGNVRTQRPGRLNPVNLRLAMSIGGTAVVREIDRLDWVRLATQLQLEADRVIDRVADIADRAPDAMADVVRRESASEWKSRIPGQMVDGVAKQAVRCQEALRGRPLSERHR